MEQQKNAKSIEDKINEAEGVLNGIRKQLAPNSGSCWGEYWSSKPTDVVSLVTDKYNIVVAKWDSHSYERGTGVAWTQWLSVHYSESGLIRKVSTEKIVIRDKYSSEKDLRHYWGLNHAGASLLSPDILKVEWIGQNGNGSGPHYLIDLAKCEVIESYPRIGRT